MDVTTGLRITDHLPLAERQAGLPEELRRFHRTILEWFAAHGSPPIADSLELDDALFSERIRHLASHDLVVVDGDRITGAYPLTTDDTPHRVSIDGVEVGAMCSLDAIAMAPMFGRRTVTTSSCAVTGDPVRVVMEGETVLSAEPPTVHIGIGFQETHGCAATTLYRDMVFLRDAGAARRWQGEDADAAPVFDLASALELGARFFGPLIDEDTLRDV